MARAWQGRPDLAPLTLAVLWVCVASFLLLIGAAGLVLSAYSDPNSSQEHGVWLLMCAGLLMLTCASTQACQAGPPCCWSCWQRDPEGKNVRCMIGAPFKFKDLGAEVSTFSEIYIRPDRTTVTGSPYPAPSTKVVPNSACVCCLASFAPRSQVTVLRCGHVYHRECIVRWSLSGSSSASECPICREGFELLSV
ncbi:unnamed protein product [Symbiodinium natans]|uniref:RING-type domain-containing protein n=1 Tax=Symbiodinium natans TaxID=878477 RepID=A0A812LQG8_9DINO|nr:unnamed protein product [Symbiodinium natans]